MSSNFYKKIKNISMFVDLDTSIFSFSQNEIHLQNSYWNIHRITDTNNIFIHILWNIADTFIISDSANETNYLFQFSSFNAFYKMCI